MKTEIQAIGSRQQEESTTRQALGNSKKLLNF